MWMCDMYSGSMLVTLLFAGKSNAILYLEFLQEVPGLTSK